jgi:hypothetical protein
MHTVRVLKLLLFRATTSLTFTLRRRRMTAMYMRYAVLLNSCFTQLHYSCFTQFYWLYHYKSTNTDTWRAAGWWWCWEIHVQTDEGAEAVPRRGPLGPCARWAWNVWWRCTSLKSRMHTYIDVYIYIYIYICICVYMYVYRPENVPDGFGHEWLSRRVEQRLSIFCRSRRQRVRSQRLLVYAALSN